MKVVPSAFQFWSLLRLFHQTLRELKIPALLSPSGISPPKSKWNDEENPKKQGQVQ